jgi:protein TonB
VNSDRIFGFTILISILFHGILIAHKTDLFKIDSSRIIKIPVVLEQKKIEKPKSKPPKPKPNPKPKRKPKPEPVEKKIEKPEELRKEITKVSESKDGLRAGELVDAPVGDYEKGQGTGLEPEPEKKVDVIAEIKKYLKTVRKNVAKNKIYPVFAQRHGITGKVKVSFYINNDGTFEQVTVKKSSGSSILDEAAVETIVKLSGKIKRPELTGKKKVKTSVTIKYELS